jgi:aromatic ring-cleaving dioxygenase
MAVNSFELKSIDEITDYHAHVYYTVKTREQAAHLRQYIEQFFDVRMGRWRDEIVGPHVQSMYQVAFEPSSFYQIVPWMMLNHLELSILVHPNTGDALRDHTQNALWIGEKLGVRTDFFM